jgi:hypothetical protein
MQQLHPFGLMTQRVDERARQDGAAIFLPLPVAYENLPVLEIKVFNPQPHRLHEPQPRAGEQPGYQPVGARELRQQPLHLLAGEDDGYAGRVLGALDAFDVRQLDLEHVPVEEEQGAECHVLCRGGDLASDGEVGEEEADLLRPHLLRVALLVEEGEAPDPIRIRPLT